MKLFGFIIFIIIYLAGMYLRFIHKVPPEKQANNFFMSWFLIIMGFIGGMTILFLA